MKEPSENPFEDQFKNQNLINKKMIDLIGDNREMIKELIDAVLILTEKVRELNNKNLK